MAEMVRLQEELQSENVLYRKTIEAQGSRIEALSKQMAKILERQEADRIEADADRAVVARTIRLVRNYITPLLITLGIGGGVVGYRVSTDEHGGVIIRAERVEDPDERDARYLALEEAVSVLEHDAVCQRVMISESHDHLAAKIDAVSSRAKKEQASPFLKAAQDQVRQVKSMTGAKALFEVD